jgi:hypothetical protein
LRQNVVPGVREYIEQDEVFNSHFEKLTIALGKFSLWACGGGIREADRSMAAGTVGAGRP